MRQTEFIDGRDIRIKPYDANSIAVYYKGGCKKEGIKPRRLFTISRPRSYIQLLYKNDREVGVLRDMDSLDPQSERALQEALDKFYVIPKIIEIKDIYEEYGVTRWDVVTDRGHRIFEVQSRNTDIHLLDNGRVLIRDVDNNRYEIPDYRELSKESYKLLEGEI